MPQPAPAQLALVLASGRFGDFSRRGAVLAAADLVEEQADEQHRCDGDEPKAGGEQDRVVAAHGEDDRSRHDR